MPSLGKKITKSLQIQRIVSQKTESPPCMYTHIYYLLGEEIDFPHNLLKNFMNVFSDFLKMIPVFSLDF